MAESKARDAIALLKEDHRKVEELFEKFKHGEAEGNEALVLEICTELSIHAMLEEEILSGMPEARPRLWSCQK